MANEEATNHYSVMIKRNYSKKLFLGSIFALKLNIVKWKYRILFDLKLQVCKGEDWTFAKLKWINKQ